MQALSALLIHLTFLSPLLPGTYLTPRQRSWTLGDCDAVHVHQLTTLLSQLSPPRCRNTAEMMDLDDDEEEPQMRPVCPLITASVLADPEPTSVVGPSLTPARAPDRPLYQRLCVLLI